MFLVLVVFRFYVTIFSVLFIHLTLFCVLFTCLTVLSGLFAPTSVVTFWVNNLPFQKWSFAQLSIVFVPSSMRQCEWCVMCEWCVICKTWMYYLCKICSHGVYSCACSCIIYSRRIVLLKQIMGLLDDICLLCLFL